MFQPPPRQSLDHIETVRIIHNAILLGTAPHSGDPLGRSIDREELRRIKERMAEIGESLVGGLARHLAQHQSRFDFRIQSADLELSS